MTMRITTILTAFLLIFAAPVSANTAWTVEEGSRLGFIATQGGAPVEGVFERFDAKIAFAADDLANSKVAVEIEIASVNSKSKDRDAAIISPGLFDVSKWPTASFETKSFRKTGDGQYEAEAMLTMRGVSRDVVLPFTLKVSDGKAHAKGELKVERLDFGIGQGVWKDTSVVGNSVTIFIDLCAKR